MKKETEEKAKVGRPKLADEETKSKAVKSLLACVVLLVGLVIGGLISFSGINSSRLTGVFNSNNSFIVYGTPTKNYFAVQWTSKNGISSITVRKSDKNGSNGSKIITVNPVKNEKGSAWGFGKGGSANGKIKADTYYKVSAKFDDNTSLTLLVKTAGGKNDPLNTLTAKNVKYNSFDLYWTSVNGISSFTVYNSNKNWKVGSKITSHSPTKNEKGSAWRIGNGGSAAGKILQNSYYIVSAKFDDGQVLNVKIKTPAAPKTTTKKKAAITTTAANTLTVKNITNTSFDIYWKSKKGISSFTIYNSNSKKQVGSKIGSKSPNENEKGSAWRIGTGGSWAGKILKDSYYIASAKFDDGQVINVHVRTKGATTKKTTTTKKKATTPAPGENVFLYCPKTAKVNKRFICYTNMPGVKIEIPSKNLKKGYTSVFTTTVNDHTKQGWYSKAGTITVKASKSGYKTTTLKVVIK